MKEEAKALKKDMADLEVLHRDSASLEHAIRKYDDQWHEFLPSRFVSTRLPITTSLIASKAFEIRIIAA